MSYDKIETAEQRQRVAPGGAAELAGSGVASYPPLRHVRGVIVGKKLVIHCYPWYIADWKKSEKVASLSLSERGLYRELLDLCYASGSIPNDPVIIARLIGCAESEVRRAWVKVMDCFSLGDDGRLRNARADEVLLTISESRAKQSKGGRNGSTKRWRMGESCDEDGYTHNSTIGQPIGQPIVDPQYTPSLPLPHPPSLPLLVAPAEPPAPAAPPPENLDAQTRALIDEILPLHPRPGNRAMAVSALERILAIAVDPAAIGASIRRNHAAWREYWDTQPGSTFRPMLHRWFADGDYMHPPARTMLPKFTGPPPEDSPIGSGLTDEEIAVLDRERMGKLGVTRRGL